MSGELSVPFSQPARSLVLAGNRCLLLHESPSIWVVRSGEVAIFAVAFEAGVAIGARRYLFSCHPGDAIVACPDLPDPTYGLVGITIQETELWEWQPADGQTWTGEAADAGINLLQTWFHQFHAILAVNPDSSWNWQRPATWGTAWEKLPQQYQALLSSLKQQEKQSQAQEWQQFQEREQWNQQSQQRQAWELAALLQPERSPVEEGGDVQVAIAPQTEEWLLYRAAQVVGQALGVTMQFPTQPENLRRAKHPLEAIARASGVRIRRVVLAHRWWQRDCGPLLGYLRDGNHPVALLPVAPSCYELFDPALNCRTPITAADHRNLSPIAYTFYRSLPKQRLRFWDVLHFGWQRRGRDGWAAVWTGLVAVLLSMVLPQVTALFIDQAIPSGDRSLLWHLSLALLAASVGAATFQWLQGVALLRLETWLEAETQAAIWDRLLLLAVPFFRQYAIGDLRSRAIAISRIRRYLNGPILRSLLASSFGLLNLLLLFYYNAKLALIALIAVLAIAALTLLACGAKLPQTLPLQEVEGRIFGLMVQLLNGVAKLRMAGAESRAYAYWGRQYRQQQQLTLQQQHISDRLRVLNQFIWTVSTAVLFGVVGDGWQSSPTASANLTPVLSTGTFLAFNIAFGSLITSSITLSSTLVDILAIVALWQHAQPILTTLPEINEHKADPGLLSGRIALENVTFRYQEGTAPILDQVTMRVEPGEFVAIVGPSGSGKSMVFRLLLGFETPQSGQVYYDSQSLTALNLQAVRRQIGVLLQNSRTTTASIFDNIAGSTLITMDEAWEAAHQAGLTEDIAAMPMGMHTLISEGGGNLSGGQRQRLLIARALALKPQILLFDEATSFLDNRTQAIVSASLEQLNITRIVIAHRLSTIQHADRIYVLQGGRVVEQGQFQELLNQGGLFTRLMQRQMAE